MTSIKKKINEDAIIFLIRNFQIGKGRQQNNTLKNILKTGVAWQFYFMVLKL